MPFIQNLFSHHPPPGFIVVLLIAFNAELTFAQYELTTASGGDLRQHLAFENLPLPIKALVDSAIKYYNNDPDPRKSIAALQKIRALDGAYEYQRIFRSWIYQWLAFNYDLLKQPDSVKTYVRLSTKTNMEIWHDYKYFRVPETVQGAFQEYWTALQERFLKKRKSWRVAVGPIARAEFSNRFGIATGIGTSVIRIEELTEAKFFQDLKLFQDLLFYVRAQRMRKNIERLTAGFYGEFSLSLKESEKPVKILSFGPILSYAYQSGWELGSTFEIFRFVIGGKTRISQTVSIEDKKLAYTYANFELYIRKWF